MRHLLLLALLAAAPPEPTLALSGDTVTAGKVTLAQLRAIESVDATWTAHGQAHAVQGVSVDALLRARGWTPGPMSPTVPKTEKRSGYRKVLLATARDGFSAVFSVAELTRGMGNTRALVIWSLDGKPLPAGMGPLRLVVLTDGEPSRSLYALDRLEVVEPAPRTTARSSPARSE